MNERHTSRANETDCSTALRPLATATNSWQPVAMSCAALCALCVMGCANEGPVERASDSSQVQQALGADQEEEDTDAEASADALERSRTFYEAERERRRAQRDPGATHRPADDDSLCEVEDEGPLRRRGSTRLTAEEMAARPPFEPTYLREGDVEQRIHQRSDRRAAGPGEEFEALREAARADVREQMLAEGYSIEAIEERHEPAVAREAELLRAEAQRLAHELVRCEPRNGCTLAVGD